LKGLGSHDDYYHKLLHKNIKIITGFFFIFAAVTLNGAAGGEDNDIDDKGFRRRPEQRAANTFTSTDSQEVKCQ
jgi:hypothetical protein